MNRLSVLILQLPLFLLIAGKGKTGFLIGLAVWLVYCAALWIGYGKTGKKPAFAICFPLPTLILCIAAGVLFYLRWNPSARLAPLASLLHRPLKQTCLIAAAFLSFLSAFGIDCALQCLRDLSGRSGENSGTPSPLSVRIFIFLTALMTVTLNSKCSPLYPFNDWVDPNTMFTVGKGVLKGFVPYRDLYEQKGPMILFVHTLGAAVSFDSFLGIWILEVLFCFLFLYLVRKTAALFAGDRGSLLIPAAALIVCSGTAFQSGDSAEEFALPFLMYSLYVGCKALKASELPSGKEFFLIGVTSGFIFWSKYSMVGSYIGWFITFLIFALKHGKIRQLLRGLGLILAGLILLSLPIFAYFAVHGALEDFLTAYFYNNLFLYPMEKSRGILVKVLSSVWSGAGNFLKNFPLAAVFTAAGLIRMLLRKERDQFLFLLLNFISCFMLVYIGGRYFPYYCLLFGAFAVFGILWAAELLARLPILQKGLSGGTGSYSVLSFGMAMILLCCVSRNMDYLEYEKEDLLPYKMKAYIEASGIEDPTLLNYRRLDLGINTVAGLIPKMRFFCAFNITELTEMETEQETCLREGCVDFVVAHSPSDSTWPEFPAYEHAGWFPGTVAGGLAHFHYYVRK